MSSPGSVCCSAYPCSLILPDTYFTHSTRQGQGQWVAEGYWLTGGLLNLGPGQVSSLLSLLVHTCKRRSDPSPKAAAKSLASA